MWTEAAEYPDVESMIIELQAAPASLVQSLPSLGLELTSDKRSFYSFIG